MTIVQSDLDALQKAMAKGVKSVTYNGETVVYRSMDEMIQAERRLMKALGLIGTGRRRFAVFNRGL